MHLSLIFIVSFSISIWHTTNKKYNSAPISICNFVVFFHEISLAGIYFTQFSIWRMLSVYFWVCTLHIVHIIRYSLFGIQWGSTPNRDNEKKWLKMKKENQKFKKKKLKIGILSLNRRISCLGWKEPSERIQILYIFHSYEMSDYRKTHFELLKFSIAHSTYTQIQNTWCFHSSRQYPLKQPPFYSPFFCSRCFLFLHRWTNTMLILISGAVSHSQSLLLFEPWMFFVLYFYHFRFRVEKNESASTNFPMSIDTCYKNPSQFNRLDSFYAKNGKMHFPPALALALALGISVYEILVVWSAKEGEREKENSSSKCWYQWFKRFHSSFFTHSILSTLRVINGSLFEKMPNVSRFQFNFKFLTKYKNTYLVWMVAFFEWCDIFRGLMFFWKLILQLLVCSLILFSVFSSHLPFRPFGVFFLHFDSKLCSRYMFSRRTLDNDNQKSNRVFGVSYSKSA